jgi:hypothetical protein
LLSGKSGAEIITLVERSQDLSSAAKAEVLEVPLRIQMSKKAEESFSLREWLTKISQDLVFAPRANDKTPLLEAFETKEEIVSAMSGIIFSASDQRIKKALEENQLISEIAEFMSSPKSQTIALVPGAFKPPHRGHLDMVKHYSKLSDVVVILISPLSRGSGTGEITVSDSKKVWDIYLNAEGLTDVRVEISEYNSPIRAAIEYGNKPEVAGSHIILGTSTKLNSKGKEDSDRFSAKMQQYAPAVKMLDPMKYVYVPDEEPLNASDFRQAILDGEDIGAWIPPKTRPFIDDILQVLAPESISTEKTGLAESKCIFSIIEEEMSNLCEEDTIKEDSIPRMNMRDGGGTEEWTNDKKKKETSSFLSDKKFNERPEGEEETERTSSGDSVDQEIIVTKDREVKIKNKVNEISASGGAGPGQTGDIEGYAGGNKNEESLIREDDDELIEEILNYLSSDSGE